VCEATCGGVGQDPCECPAGQAYNPTNGQCEACTAGESCPPDCEAPYFLVEGQCVYCNPGLVEYGGKCVACYLTGAHWEDGSGENITEAGNGDIVYAIVEGAGSCATNFKSLKSFRVFNESWDEKLPVATTNEKAFRTKGGISVANRTINVSFSEDKDISNFTLVAVYTLYGSTDQQLEAMLEVGFPCPDDYIEIEDGTSAAVCDDINDLDEDPALVKAMCNCAGKNSDLVSGESCKFAAGVCYSTHIPDGGSTTSVTDCVQKIKAETDCTEGGTRSITYKWLGINATTTVPFAASVCDSLEPSCNAVGCTSSIPCPLVIKLSFFGAKQLIVALILLVIIYLIYASKNKTSGRRAVRKKR